MVCSNLDNGAPKWGGQNASQVSGPSDSDGPETCDAFCLLFHSFTSGKGTREGNSMSMEEAGKRNARPRKFLESTRPGKILEKHCENASW